MEYHSGLTGSSVLWQRNFKTVHPWSLIVLETRGSVLLTILLTEQVSPACSDLCFSGFVWCFGMDAYWPVLGKTRMSGKGVWSLMFYFYFYFFLLKFLCGFWEELNLFIHSLASKPLISTFTYKESNFLPLKSFPQVSTFSTWHTGELLGTWIIHWKEWSFVTLAKLLDGLRILASRENLLSFVIVVPLYSSPSLSAAFNLKTRTKYWDLLEYPAKRKHMQNIKILEAWL